MACRWSPTQIVSGSAQVVPLRTVQRLFNEPNAIVAMVSMTSQARGQGDDPVGRHTAAEEGLDLAEANRVSQDSKKGNLPIVTKLRASSP